MSEKITQFTMGMSNIFIVQDKKVILVDTGNEGGIEEFERNCAEVGVVPEDIQLIIITHEHADHFINAKKIKELTKAPLLCHKKAEESLKKGLPPSEGGRNAKIIEFFATLTPRPLGNIPAVEPDIVIEREFDLNQYGVSAKLICTPGHTEGSISLIFDSGAAIVGDVLSCHEEVGGLQLDQTGNDEQQLFQSVSTLIESAETFYLGHGNRCFKKDEIEKVLQEELSDK
jgi:hydroxyacylglutathione hydrolase